MDYIKLKELQLLFFQANKEIRKNFKLNKNQILALIVLKIKWKNYEKFELKDLFKLKQYHNALNDLSLINPFKSKIYTKYVETLLKFRVKESIRLNDLSNLMLNVNNEFNEFNEFNESNESDESNE